jgi:tight adherence protein B
MRQALLCWHDRVGGGCRRGLVALRNRLELGQQTAAAVSSLGDPLEDDAAALATLVAVHSRTGGNAAAMVARLADSAERRMRAVAKAASYGAGARLSARLVAGLPLAFAPIAPMTRAPIGDPAGLFLLLLGGGLAVAGLAWVSALFPRPVPHDHPAAVVAETLAAAVDGGGDAASALRDVCANPPPGGDLVAPRIGRLMDLGASWTEALARSGDPDLGSLGASMRTAVAMGLPLSRALRDLAEAARAERERAFEAAVRRAPVRMAVPLSLCVLPSFVVLGIAPLLRGLSVGL